MSMFYMVDQFKIENVLFFNLKYNIKHLPHSFYLIFKKYYNLKYLYEKFIYSVMYFFVLQKINSPTYSLYFFLNTLNRHKTFSFVRNQTRHAL